MGSLLIFFSVLLSQAQNGPHLYKIQPPQENTPCSYILGGAHLANYKLLPPIVFSLIEKSDHYFVETDVVFENIKGHFAPPLTQTFSDGLNTVITAEALSELKKYFSIFSNITEDNLNYAAPEEITRLIKMSHLFALYHGHNQFFDADMLRVALNSNPPKKISALETKEELLQLVYELNELSDEHITRDKAISMINNLPDIEDILKQTSLYEIANSNQILLSDASHFDSYIPGPILTVRNQKWLPVIIQHCSIESCFYTVGMGHLYSGLGLIELLNKSGFQVSQVR